MIRSKSGNRLLFNSIFIFIFFSFVAGIACVQDAEATPLSGLLNLPAFFKAEGIIFVLMSVVFLIGMLRKRDLRITQDSIYIKYLFQKETVCALNGISNMTWENKNFFYSSRGGTTSIDHRSISIWFKDGSVLKIDQREFLNFDEIKVFFFDYCRRHGIIHILPLSERKKSILKRKAL